MKIGTKLRVIGVSFVIATILLGLVLYLSSRQVQKAAEENAIAQQIANPRKVLAPRCPRIDPIKEPAVGGPIVVGADA